MKWKQSRLMRVLAFCALVLTLWSRSVPAAAVPPLPYGPWGTVTIDGVLAPPGAVVTAWIGGVQYAQTTVVSDGLYSIDVPGDDPDTPQKDGGVTGETVQFRVNGVIAPQTGTWASGVVQRIDLTITTATATATTTALPTSTLTATPTATPTQTLPAATATATATPTLPGAATATVTSTATATLPGAATATVTSTATATLPGAATATMTATATLPGAATPTVTATPTATLSGAATATMTRTVTRTATATGAPAMLAVRISKEVLAPWGGEARLDEIIAYRLLIHNEGQTTVNRLSVVDQFPGTLAYVSSSPEGAPTGLGSVVWEDLIAQCGTIPPGGTLQIILYLRAIAPVSQATNWLMVNAGDGASEVTLWASASIRISAASATATATRTETPTHTGTATRTTTPPLTGTATPTTQPGLATILGSVTWQARPPAPDPAWSGTITVTLGGIKYVLSTDAFGKFTLPNVPSGVYDLTVKGLHTLSVVKANVALGPGVNVISLGVMTEGDANGDDIVDIVDFSLLRTLFGTSDPRGDFNQDGVVDIIDFSVLRMNFGKMGPLIVSLEKEDG